MHLHWSVLDQRSASLPQSTCTKIKASLEHALTAWLGRIAIDLQFSISHPNSGAELLLLHVSDHAKLKFNYHRHNVSPAVNSWNLLCMKGQPCF